MVSFNYILSCVLFAILADSCTSSATSSLPSLRGNGGLLSNVTTSLSEVTYNPLWSVGYGVSSAYDRDPADISEIWKEVTITINSRLYLAILSDYGLYVSGMFAFHFPANGTATLGPNTFRYNINYNIGAQEAMASCPETETTHLSIVGSVRPNERTESWSSQCMRCNFTHTNRLYSFCKPCVNAQENPKFSKYACKSITMTNEKKTIPLYDDATCSFFPSCMLDKYFLKIADAKTIQDCYQGMYYNDKVCIIAPPTPTPAPTTAPTSAPTPAPTTRAPTPAPTAFPTSQMRDCGLPRNAELIPEFPMGTIKAVGYSAAKDSNSEFGLQLHLVPFNTSSCPVTAPANIFGADPQLVRYPAGCEGYVYATTFEKLKCAYTANYKFRYEPQGRFTVRVSDDGRIFTP